MVPPNRLAPLTDAASTLRILGRKSRSAVAPNSAIAHSGCHSGQSGKSWYGCRKYFGALSVCTARSAVDRMRNTNHSSADRYAITPLMNTARCATCSPLSRKRRKFIRLPWHQRRSRDSSSTRFGGISS